MPLLTWLNSDLFSALRDKTNAAINLLNTVSSVTSVSNTGFSIFSVSNITGASISEANARRVGNELTITMTLNGTKSGSGSHQFVVTCPTGFQLKDSSINVGFVSTNGGSINQVFDNMSTDGFYTVSVTSNRILIYDRTGSIGAGGIRVVLHITGEAL